MGADGNCFYRALSVQLIGDESLHTELRAATVACLRGNESHVKLFLDTDEAEFEVREGRWAADVRGRQWPGVLVPITYSQ